MAAIVRLLLVLIVCSITVTNQTSNGNDVQIINDDLDDNVHSKNKENNYNDGAFKSDAKEILSDDIKSKQIYRNNNDNDNDNALTKSEFIKMLNTKNMMKVSEMKTKYIPIIEIPEELWPYLQKSKNEIYNSLTTYPSKHSFDYLIGNKNDIQLILNENDLQLTKDFTNGFKAISHDIQVNKQYYDFVEIISKTWSHSDDSDDNDDNDDNDDDEIDYIFNVNGGTSDMELNKLRRPSTGMNGEYFKVNAYCYQRKGCNIYPINRVLHKSGINNNEYTCNDILNKFIPQIYDCVADQGQEKENIKRCRLLIDSGYYRQIYKVYDKEKDKYLVLKFMKQGNKEDDARNLLRHVRESIMSHYLKNEEIEYMNKFGYKFISNNNEKRAFPFVHELGHCIYPNFISISPYYNMTLLDFIQNGSTLKATIRELVKMSLDMARSIEILHNMRGGPFHHTDIGPRQFMIDKNGNVLINDFNRGKFQKYYFPEDNGDTGNVFACRYCPHRSRGEYRAPEEHIGNSLDESLDVFSIGLTIWSLFSGTLPFPQIDYDDLVYLYYNTARRPIMPSNMPYALKDIITSILSQKPSKRPNAKELRQRIQEIYDNIDKYTRKHQNEKSEYIREHKYFRDTNHPNVPKEYEGMDDPNGR